jgi:hypothetical protein
MITPNNTMDAMFSVKLCGASPGLRVLSRRSVDPFPSSKSRRFTRQRAVFHSGHSALRAGEVS